MSAVILCVKRHECLIENKNIVKKFCNGKPSQKNIEPHKNFTDSNKKVEKHSMNSKVHRISMKSKS